MRCVSCFRDRHMGSRVSNRIYSAWIASYQYRAYNGHLHVPERMFALRTYPNVDFSCCEVSSSVLPFRSNVRKMCWSVCLYSCTYATVL